MRSLPALALRLTLALGLLLALAPLFVASAQSPRRSTAADTSTAIASAMDYLKSKQLANGGFEGFTAGTADDFTTVRVVLATAAAPRLPSFLSSSTGATALDYLASRAKAYTHDDQNLLFPGRAGQLAAAVAAAGRDPTNFGGMNLVGELQTTYNASTGTYSTAASQGYSTGAAGTINQLWAIIGLAAARQPIPTKATDYLLTLQETDGQGGWGYGLGSDVDTTGFVLQAFAASGNVPASNAKVQQAIAYLEGKQLTSGGWPTFDGTLNSDSTATVIQAMAAVGIRPATLTKSAGRTPYDDLVSLQAADGSFDGNPLGTADAVPGLATIPFPVVRYQTRLPMLVRVGTLG